MEGPKTKEKIDELTREIAKAQIQEMKENVDLSKKNLDFLS